MHSIYEKGAIRWLACLLAAISSSDSLCVCYVDVGSRKQRSSSQLVLVSVGYAAFAPGVVAKGGLLPLVRNRSVFAKSLPI